HEIRLNKVPKASTFYAQHIHNPDLTRFACVAVSSGAGQVYVWDLQHKAEWTFPITVKGNLMFADLSTDGKSLLVGTGITHGLSLTAIAPGGLYLWDVATGKPRTLNLGGGEWGYSKGSLSPSGGSLAFVRSAAGDRKGEITSRAELYDL